MDPDRFDHVAEIFRDALEEETGEREAFVRTRCGDDEALRAEVASLLEEHARPGSSLDGLDRDAFVARWARDSTARSSTLPERFGPFRIESLLGRGGMGNVYRARQSNPTRDVALKVLHLDAGDPRSRGRFELEAELLARLAHPGIAQVYEAGTAETERGRVPYFAMEYVQGADLLAHAEAHDLDDEARVELIARVADAVQHAHERGVVHRDLKPANILVDTTGRPRVLDFGIARLTDEDLQRSTLATLPGQVLGTLRYMSPEQASGLPDEVDTRTDIYSLGVVLYELLARKPPYDVGESSLPEALRTICDREPDRFPERRAADDLEVITRKALEKEKARRYASAAELAADLRRYLRREPIHARPASRFYAFRKLGRRNRAASVAAALFLAALVVGLVAVSILYARSERLRRAESFRRYVANLSVVGSALQEGRQRTAERLLADCPPEHRGWEWRHLALEARLFDRSIQAHDRSNAAVLSGDGQVLVTGDPNGEVAFWEARTGVLVRRVPRVPPSRVSELAVDERGRNVLVRGPSAVEHVTIEGARAPLRDDDAGGAPRALALDGDGRRGFVAHPDHGVDAWDLGQGRLVSTERYGPGLREVLRAGPDFMLVESDALTLLDPTGARGGWRVRAERVAAGLVAAHGPDHGYVALGDRFGTVTIREPAGGEIAATWSAHDEAVSALAVLDAETLATASWDGAIRVWDRRTGEEVNTIAAHDGRIVSLCATEGGGLVSVGSDGRVRWWNPAASARRRFRPAVPGEDGNCAAEISADGRYLVTQVGKGHLVVRDARTGAIEWTGRDGREFALLAATGEVAMTAWESVLFYDLETGRETRRLDLDGTLGAIRSFDGGRAFMVRKGNGRSGAITAWGTNVLLFASEDLAQLGEWDDCAFGALASDHRTFFLVHQLQRELLAVDLDTRESRSLCRDVNHIVTHDRLPLLAVGNVDGTFDIWDTDELRRVVTLAGHPDRVGNFVSFHPDGTRLATVAEADPTLRIWDVGSGERLATLRFDLEYRARGNTRWTRGLMYARFTADGHRLVIGGKEGSAWVLDTRPEDARQLWGVSASR